MDSGTKKRLALGFLSSTFSRLAASVIQLIQVPVLLHFWGLPRYGEWLILSGIPVYLSFSSIGFGNVAGNEMSMLVGAGGAESCPLPDECSTLGKIHPPHTDRKK